MNRNEDLYKVLHEVQTMCNELNRKIDSIIQIMEVFTMYMQYSNMMSDFNILKAINASFSIFSQSNASKNQTERSDTHMNPQDLQKMMTAAKQSNQQMTQDEFNQIFETLKQGKSAEEVARMEQMVQMAKSFMK